MPPQGPIRGVVMIFNAAAGNLPAVSWAPPCLVRRYEEPFRGFVGCSRDSSGASPSGTLPGEAKTPEADWDFPSNRARLGGSGRDTRDHGEACGGGSAQRQPPPESPGPPNRAEPRSRPVSARVLGHLKLQTPGLIAARSPHRRSRSAAGSGCRRFRVSRRPTCRGAFW